jgi:hypothetical protein
MQEPFITPFTSDSSKWMIFYFALTLDCSEPVLYTLYISAIADCRVKLHQARWIAFDFHLQIVRFLRDCINALNWHPIRLATDTWADGKYRLNIFVAGGFASSITVALHNKTNLVQRHFQMQWGEGMLEYYTDKAHVIPIKYGQIESTIKRELLQFLKK